MLLIKKGCGSTKRSFALIGIIILTLGVLGTLFYFLLEQDNSYITYFKIQSRPSFVVGINEKNNVVFYNALNSEGNKYNLLMFQGKNLSEMIELFIEKIDYDDELNKEINVTIMTKNNIRENEIFKIIQDTIRSKDKRFMIVNHEPNNDELERYSNENVYNMKASLKNDDIKVISHVIYDKVKQYVDAKIGNIMDFNNDFILENEGYFNDYNLFNINLNEYNVVLLEKSNYQVDFTFDEEGNYVYNIILNLELEKENASLERKIVEVYSYSYQINDEQELLSNLKIYYYLINNQ